MRFSLLSPLVVALAVACAGIAPSVMAADAEVRPTHCVVNGDAFAEHKNQTITVTHEGDTIDVCCKKCAKKFSKDPEKYLKKYKEAQKKAASAVTAKGNVAKAETAAPAMSCCSQ